MTSPNDSYEVGAVANFMIGRAERNNHLLTHLDLHRLVYIAYGLYIASTHRGLFVQGFEAWQYGPIVPELYHEFKRFGSAPIQGWSVDFDHETEKFNIPVVRDSDGEALRALNLTWILYGQASSIALIQVTHLPGGPWARARAAGSRTVPSEWIQEGFANQFSQFVYG